MAYFQADSVHTLCSFIAFKSILNFSAKWLYWDIGEESVEKQAVETSSYRQLTSDPRFTQILCESGNVFPAFDGLPSKKILSLVYRTKKEKEIKMSTTEVADASAEIAGKEKFPKPENVIYCVSNSEPGYQNGAMFELHKTLETAWVTGWMDDNLEFRKDDDEDEDEDEEEEEDGDGAGDSDVEDEILKSAGSKKRPRDRPVYDSDDWSFEGEHDGDYIYCRIQMVDLNAAPSDGAIFFTSLNC